MDINYKAIDTLADGRLVLRVSGDISNVLDLDEDFYEELKTELFKNGMDALEDFAGMDLSNYDDKDTLDNILDDVLFQMPDEEVIKFYRKYLK